MSSATRTGCGGSTCSPSRERLEQERDQLARALTDRPSAAASPLRWFVAGCAVVVALVTAGVALAGSGAPEAPVAVDEAPPEARTLDAVSPDPAGLEESNADTAFFGQYWEARVADPGQSGLAPGRRCLLTTDPGLHDGAGIARVECGEVVLHQTSVTPPWRENSGFCHYRDRELLSAPVRGSSRPGCGVSTAARQARCDGGVELEIRTLIRDPRRRPPPSLGS